MARPKKPAAPCPFCGLNESASLHATFGIVICSPCLHANTITNSRLLSDWDLPASALAGVRHTSDTYRSHPYRVYLLSDVLPLVAAHHGLTATTTWETVKAARAERNLELAKVREWGLAVKAAVRAAGVLLKDAKRCPAYIDALDCRKGSYSAPRVVAIAVQAFIADQAAKVTWLQHWFFTTAATGTGAGWWDGPAATVEMSRIETDAHITLEGAHAAMADWVTAKSKETRKRRRGKKTKATQERENERESECELECCECYECGSDLHRRDALVSVYHPGTWCDACVEADPELCNSKWESLDER